MKNSPFIHLVVLSAFVGPAFAGSEEECRKRAENLLYQKGYVNENVCLNINNYPNISVNHDFGNIVAGDPDKPVPFKNLDSLGLLSNLMNEMIENGDEAGTEVLGYTDGQIAVFKSYDQQFSTSDQVLSPPKEVDDYDSTTNKKISVSRRKKIDESKYQEILKGISDPATKEAIEKAYSNIPLEKGMRYLEFHDYGKGGQRPVGASGHFSDMMRNYLLSMDRGQKFCEKLTANQQEQCKKNIKGVISPNLITNRPMLKGNFVNGTCDNRRGVEYRFHFKDDHDEKSGSVPGEFSPEFKIPGRDLQNRMQVAASMDFIGKFSKSSEIGPLNDDLKDVLKDPYLLDVEKDRGRFRKLMSGTGCENNDYQIDNLRRAYWSLNLKAAEIKNNKELNRRLNANPEEKKIFNAILSGDYKAISASPKAQMYLKLAGLPASEAIGYVNQIKQVYRKSPQDITNDYKDYVTDPKKVHERDQLINIAKVVNGKVSAEELIMIDSSSREYDPLAEQMVLLMRASVVGNYPYNGKENRNLVAGFKLNDVKEDPNAIPPLAHASVTYNPYHLTRLGDLSGVTFQDELKGENKVSKKFIKETSKLMEKKPSNLFPASPYDPEAIAYTQTDINACNSSAAALLENIQNGDGQSMLRSNQEKGTKVSFSADQVNQVKIRDLTKKDLMKQMGQEKAENFIQDGHSHGWICKECGSGVHVNPKDGSVQFISRFRDVGNKKSAISELANKTALNSKQENLSLASLQNLIIYEIPNCAGCNCLKQQSITNLDDYLKNNAEVHKMIQTDNGVAKILKEKNGFEVKSDESCLFVPPVPHSCNYDPTGDSEGKRKEPKVWQHFYCKLEEKLKTKTGLKTTQKTQDEITNLCSKKVFPASESACGLRTMDVKTDKTQGVQQSPGTVQQQ